ncbi:MAG: ABC transporter substrate-binding protein [Alphaproteobacteria bacterium]|nr:ABC transporter substrate-binding protein [Alphaproteobacteria bacterium]
MVDHVNFPYRSETHLPFLHVVAESGSWEKHGLDVSYNKKISSADAHLEIPSEHIEFVGGNHVSTYAHRARGDTWVYLGQTMNFTNVKLVVRPESGIHGVADLKGKVVGSYGMHPGLNDWLYLKQRGLDVDREDVKIINQHGGNMDPTAAEKPKPLWQWVVDGDVDAALVWPPLNVFGQRAGLKVIEIDPLPMIWFTTVSSSSTFVAKHPDIVERMLKGIMEGIQYFKTNPDESTAIIKKMYYEEGELDDEAAAAIYQDLAGILEPKLYPAMQSIANVYEEAIRQDSDAAKVNPMELWDLHHLRRIDDSGFIKELYSGTNQLL